MGSEAVNHYRSTIYTCLSMWCHFQRLHILFMGERKASLVFEVRAVENGVDIENVNIH